MPVIERPSTLFGSGSASQSYTYKCLSCTEQLVTDESHMAKVSCPGCGSSDVRSVAHEA